MGLMFPTTGAGMDENSLASEDNLIFPREGVRFRSEIRVTRGNCLDALVNWVKQNGMPDPGEQRFSSEEVFEMVAAAYDSHFWEEGVGWTYHKRKATGLFHGTSWYLSLGVGKVIRTILSCDGFRRGAVGLSRDSHDRSRYCFA